MSNPEEAQLWAELISHAVECGTMVKQHAPALMSDASSFLSHFVSKRAEEEQVKRQCIVSITSLMDDYKNLTDYQRTLDAEWQKVTDRRKAVEGEDATVRRKKSDERAKQVQDLLLQTAETERDGLLLSLAQTKAALEAATVEANQMLQSLQQELFDAESRGRLALTREQLRAAQTVFERIASDNAALQRRHDHLLEEQARECAKDEAATAALIEETAALQSKVSELETLLKTKEEAMEAAERLVRESRDQWVVELANFQVASKLIQADMEVLEGSSAARVVPASGNASIDAQRLADEKKLIDIMSEVRWQLEQRERLIVALSGTHVTTAKLEHLLSQHYRRGAAPEEQEDSDDDL